MTNIAKNHHCLSDDMAPNPAQSPADKSFVKTKIFDWLSDDIPANPPLCQNYVFDANQNNLSLFQKLLARVLDEISSDDRVLDLYCGVGTFSLPVAKKCNKVFGVEVVDESIVLARENADHNFIENAEFTTGQVHEWLTENAQLLKEYNVILLDPPRVGLEKAIDDIMARDFEKIIYVSCNPLALQKDLQILSEKYEVKQLSLWDLYPQTPHIETVAVLNNVKSIK